VGGVNAMIAGASPVVPVVLFILAAVLGFWGR
jgi:hypothetical protein